MVWDRRNGVHATRAAAGGAHNCAETSRCESILYYRAPDCEGVPQWLVIKEILVGDEYLGMMVRDIWRCLLGHRWNPHAFAEVNDEWSLNLGWSLGHLATHPCRVSGAAKFRSSQLLPIITQHADSET